MTVLEKIASEHESNLLVRKVAATPDEMKSVAKGLLLNAWKGLKRVKKWSGRNPVKAGIGAAIGAGTVVGLSSLDRYQDRSNRYAIPDDETR